MCCTGQEILIEEDVCDMERSARLGLLCIARLMFDPWRPLFHSSSSYDGACAADFGRDAEYDHEYPCAAGRDADKGDGGSPKPGGGAALDKYAGVEPIDGGRGGRNEFADETHFDVLEESRVRRSKYCGYAAVEEFEVARVFCDKSADNRNLREVEECGVRRSEDCGCAGVEAITGGSGGRDQFADD